MLSKEDEKKVIELLRAVWRRVDWSKMKTRVPYRDIFNHRVRAAASAENLPMFLDRLCNYFGLQTAPEEAVAIVEQLREKEEQVLDAIAQMGVYLTTMATMKKDLQTELFGGE